jgi:tripartite-type tricarboxylate transporter receptor subunit TctC
MGGIVARRYLMTAVLVACALGIEPLAAQDYPSRPVRVVIPFAAGAGTDLTGRIIAQELSKRLGQQFFVENKPGAAAQLGTDLVAKSPPDGYTLLWTVTDGLSVLPAVKVSVPYTIPDDFAFIGSVAQQPYAVAVKPRDDFKSLSGVVAYAKANPDKLNYGSAGVGSAPHMTMALLSVAAGIRMVHVPFAGLGPATNALIAGTVDIGLVTPVQVKPHVDAGALHAIAVTSKTRSRLLPEVPTLRESGLDVTAVVAYGLTAPARTPDVIVARLTQAMSETMNDKAVADRFRDLGFELTMLIGSAYRDFIVQDLEQWRGVAKAANIRIEN